MRQVELLLSAAMMSGKQGMLVNSAVLFGISAPDDPGGSPKRTRSACRAETQGT